ncbi:uncharacterized protein LOC103722302 isoform X2 [Phoenix dactylifera]|uniref:Uncharacterized protein LOC103722302 isoform X2 n=1 Tax=Phoenix dactylifera TaxID=42345 RepID=A0A8B9B2X2_PHODC|nr:uncharacterized protein LOC103722302 isoform X2 [Phoenix dactylifera]
MAAGAGAGGPSPGPVGGEEQVQVRRRTLEAVLEQCRRALDLLQDADLDTDPARDAAAGEGEGSTPRSLSTVDQELDELCDLLKSKVESSDFLEKLGSNDKSVPHNMSDENASWAMVSTTDLWEDKHIGGDDGSDPDGYVLVRQEDIVEGIACFTAACLLSLKQTKELTPNQIQEALSKTFSVKKKKSRLQKAWDGGKVIYNLASWSATAIGICQNPAMLKAASAAFWSSCRVISKGL